MKAVDLPKTSASKKYTYTGSTTCFEPPGPEDALAYAFPDALVTFTFAYGSRSQFATVPLRSFWR